MPRTTPREEREWLSWMKRCSSGDPQLGVPFAAVGLAEEAALVAVSDRLDRGEAGETGRQDAHRRKRVAVDGEGALPRAAHRALLDWRLMRALSTQAPAPGPVERRWATPPSRPRLLDGALHVWRADLTSVGDQPGRLLSGAERARAEHFPSPPARRLWVRSRGLLRELLGLYLDSDPRTLRFLTGAHGKPELPGISRISFNLSHSGHLALYAFSASGAVGVDVELPRRSIDEVAIAARAFDPADARHIGELEPSLREAEFLRLWTRHEAGLKLRGLGIGGRPSPRFRAPWIAELEPGSRGAGAVARKERPRELRCWDFLEDPDADLLGERPAAHHGRERRRDAAVFLADHPHQL